MLRDAPVAGLVKLRCGILTDCGGRLWAVHVIRHEGRFADIRCTCKLNGHVLREQTLRATTQFFRGASAAKVATTIIPTHTAPDHQQRPMQNQGADLPRATETEKGANNPSGAKTGRS